MTKKELIQRIGRDCRVTIRATLRRGGTGARRSREVAEAGREPRIAVRRRRRR